MDRILWLNALIAARSDSFELVCVVAVAERAIESEWILRDVARKGRSQLDRSDPLQFEF